MITARTTQEPTHQEIETFSKFIEAKHIRADEKNINILADYMERWGVEISDEALDLAMGKLHEAGQLSFYSAAEARYRKIAALEPERAAQLNNWFQSFNKTLIKTGDENWSNQAILLEELRGREINGPNIYDAIGRISSKRGGLHFTPAERKPDPRQHQDAGPFAPKNDTRKFMGGKLNHAFKEPGNQQTPKVNTPTDAWQQLTEGLLRAGAHSQQAAYREIYERGLAQRKSFREIYIEMSRLRASYERVSSQRGV